MQSFFYSSCTSFFLLQDVGSDVNSIAREISDPEPKIVTIGSLEKQYITAEVSCHQTIYQLHCYQHSM